MKDKQRGPKHEPETARQSYLQRKAAEMRHLYCALFHCDLPPKFPGGLCDLHEQELGGEGG